MFTQDYLKQMEVVRKKVLQTPAILPELVSQLRSGDVEMKIKAAEMLFCVVGQGAGRDMDATREVSYFSCISPNILTPHHL